MARWIELIAAILAESSSSEAAPVEMELEVVALGSSFRKATLRSAASCCCWWWSPCIILLPGISWKISFQTLQSTQESEFFRIIHFLSSTKIHCNSFASLRFWKLELSGKYSSSDERSSWQSNFQRANFRQQCLNHSKKLKRFQKQEHWQTLWKKKMNNFVAVQILKLCWDLEKTRHDHMFISHFYFLFFLLLIIILFILYLF